MRTVRSWVKSFTPGSAPGYDNKMLQGNFISHFIAHTSQRLREHNSECPEVKALSEKPRTPNIAPLTVVGEP